MKYIGIDYGTRRIGVAVSDTHGRIAFPKMVVPTEQAHTLIPCILAHEKDAGEEVGGIVIGESRSNDGEENEVMVVARRFASSLAKMVQVPIFWEWEGYSSAQAGNARRAEGAARGIIARKTPREYEIVDASAAAVILQSFLDKQAK